MHALSNIEKYIKVYLLLKKIQCLELILVQIQSFKTSTQSKK